MSVSIQSTNDYSKFKLMTGNRVIDKAHVKRLQKEMLESGNLMEVMPILVNESMFVIDGQHRLEAAKELGMEVHYIVKDDATISTARHMNVTQKNWTLFDFARSYAEGGNKNYQQFITMAKKFPNVSPSVIILFMSGAGVRDAGDDFRRGLFQIDDIGAALNDLERVDEIIYKSGVRFNLPMARAFLRLFRSDDDTAVNFDYDRFIKKLENPTAVAMFRTGSSTKACLGAVEDVYNFMSPARTVLY